jgi:antitoxin (DNA-binding transcriptional repressor) of toxin-antitoxin stability system
MEYTVEEAQKIFEELIERVINGKEIVITDGELKAKIVPIEKKTRQKKARKSR